MVNLNEDFEIYDVFDVNKNASDTKDSNNERNFVSFDEALSALNEADENFGECQHCHEEFPKGELTKEGLRYICKNCQGNLNEDLKIISDISDYTPWSGAVATWDKIEAANKVDDLEALLEDAYPDGLTMTELNDILWFDSDWVFEALGISEEEDNEEYDDEDEDDAEEDDVAESLEDTVDQDLADDRTPVQVDVNVLDNPVDYKKEIAKEKLVDESLTEDLDQDLQKWNAYVDYLRGQIEQEEKALEKAGDNDLVKAAIQRRIDAYKADLEDALPNLVKSDVADQEEPKDLGDDKADDKEEVKESLNEGFDMNELNRLLAAAKKLGLETAGDLDKFSEEHGGVTDRELLKVLEEEAAKLD